VYFEISFWSSLPRRLVKPVTVKCPSMRCQHFQNPWLRDHWADVDETWLVYSMGWSNKLLGSRIMNFGPCTPCGAKFSLIGRDDPPGPGCLYCVFRFHVPGGPN